MAKVEQMQLAIFLLYFSLPTHSQQCSYFHPVTEVHTRKAKDKLEKKKEKKKKGAVDQMQKDNAGTISE